VPALKAYIAARRKRVTHAAILAGVKARRGVDKPDTECAPQLVTWLNQNRWEGEAQADVSPERQVAIDAKSKRELAEAAQRVEFMKLSKLPENLRKSEGEIWAMIEPLRMDNRISI
jgi:hypothetical protein